MKAKALSVACAAALGVAGQAMAITPNILPFMDVFISGASAQQLTLGKIAEGLFVPGTIHVYYDTPTSGKDYRAYYGTVTGTASVLDGKNILIHNRAKGGSVFGVNPVAKATPIGRMGIDAVDGLAVADRCVPTGLVYPAVPQFNCPKVGNEVTLTQPLDVPDAGVSDLEPEMFIGINLDPTSGGALNTIEAARLATFSQNAVIFGVAVTNNLPLSLGDNLTHTQVTSMLSGTYQDWSKMGGSSTQPVVICRRANGSGSQAAFNAYFNKFPCLSKENPTVPYAPVLTAADSVPGGYEVIENSTSGAVKTCLNNAFAAGKLAIGVLSTESVPAGTDNWHHAKLDGVTASKTETAKGAYDFFVEQSFQYRTGPVPPAAAPTPSMLAFLNTFITRSGDPAYLSVLPGVAALPISYDPTLYPAGQVLKGTRQGKTCAPTQLFY